MQYTCSALSIASNPDNKKLPILVKFVGVYRSVGQASEADFVRA